MQERGFLCHALEQKEGNNHVRPWGQLEPAGPATGGWPRMFGRGQVSGVGWWFRNLPELRLGKKGSREELVVRPFPGKGCSNFKTTQQVVPAGVETVERAHELSVILYSHLDTFWVELWWTKLTDCPMRPLLFFSQLGQCLWFLRVNTREG